MCAGGQDIPVTLRVAGGVEGGKWKSENDVRATPQPEEEVETTETTETTEVPEPVGPSTPLYQPVIDRINKLSEKLPDEVAGETMEAILPRFDHTDNQFQEGIASNNNNLNQIMRQLRIRPHRPRVMDVVNPGGPGKWGGGKRNPHNPQARPPQTLGTNPQVAGLAGLFAGPQREQVMPQQGIPVPQMGTNMPARNPVHPFTGQWRGSMSQPMQPAVMEEQQMEILGQPKQFANGGIVNALMATPVGQAALRQYATGGEVGEDVEAEQVLEHTPTGATIEDILAGRATFFGPAKYRHAEVISDISDTLGVAPIKKKKKGVPWQPDDDLNEGPKGIDPVTGVQIGRLSELDYDPDLFIDDPAKFDWKNLIPGMGMAKILGIDKLFESEQKERAPWQNLTKKSPEVVAWEKQLADDQRQEKLNQYTLSLPTTSERKGAGTEGVGGIHSLTPPAIDVKAGSSPSKGLDLSELSSGRSTTPTAIPSSDAGKGTFIISPNDPEFDKYGMYDDPNTPNVIDREAYLGGIHGPSFVADKSKGQTQPDFTYGLQSKDGKLTYTTPPDLDPGPGITSAVVPGMGLVTTEVDKRGKTIDKESFPSIDPRDSKVQAQNLLDQLNERIAIDQGELGRDSIPGKGIGPTIAAAKDAAVTLATANKGINSLQAMLNRTAAPTQIPTSDLINQLSKQGASPLGSGRDTIPPPGHATDTIPPSQIEVDRILNRLDKTKPTITSPLTWGPQAPPDVPAQIYSDSDPYSFNTPSGQTMDEIAAAQVAAAIASQNVDMTPTGDQEGGEGFGGDYNEADIGEMASGDDFGTYE